jgi:hypothetical protein
MFQELSTNAALEACRMPPTPDGADDPPNNRTTTPTTRHRMRWRTLRRIQLLRSNFLRRCCFLFACDGEAEGRRASIAGDRDRWWLRSIDRDNWRCWRRHGDLRRWRSSDSNPGRLRCDIDLGWAIVVRRVRVRISVTMKRYLWDSLARSSVIRGAGKSTLRGCSSWGRNRWGDTVRWCSSQRSCGWRDTFDHRSRRWWRII